jgi:myosin heavy subunit
MVKHICVLLGIENWENFYKCLLNSIVKVRTDTLVSPLTYKKATDNRDAFAKQLYNNMFDWLVIRMNLTIQPPEMDDPSFEEKAKTIGLLDIFGFENFEP